MSRPIAQPSAKLRLVCLATGEAHEAWPIDAKEILATGEYVREAEYVPPEPEPALKKGK